MFEALAALAAVGALALWMVLVRRIRRDRWLKRDQFHQPLPTVRAAEKLGMRRWLP